MILKKKCSHSIIFVVLMNTCLHFYVFFKWWFSWVEFTFFHIFMRRNFLLFLKKKEKKRHCSINFTYLKQKPNVKVLFISLFICKGFASEKYGSISKTSGYFWRSFFSLQFRRKVRAWREGEAAVVLEKIEMKWVHAVERFVWFFSPFFLFLFSVLSFLFVSVVMNEELSRKTRSFVGDWHIRICNEIFLVSNSFWKDKTPWEKWGWESKRKFHFYHFILLKEDE